MLDYLDRQELRISEPVTMMINDCLSPGITLASVRSSNSRSFCCLSNHVDTPGTIAMDLNPFCYISRTHQVPCDPTTHERSPSPPPYNQLDKLLHRRGILIPEIIIIIGQTSVKYRSNIGQISIKYRLNYRSNVCQGSVK